MKELAVALHDKDLKLIISSPPKPSDTLPKYPAGYDYTVLGESIDYFQA